MGREGNMLNKKRILILGSEGFIGSHLIKHFSRPDYEVMGCDLFETPLSAGHYVYIKVSRLSPEWESVFTINQPDICINAAGSGNVPYSLAHPLLDFEANSLDTMRVLDVIRRVLPPCKYLHISSAAVYGNPPSLPIKEEVPLHPLSPYGWHKLISEMLCREYHELYGLNIAILRPFSVYGNGLRKQLLWDVCVKLQQQEPVVTLFGSGKESRDFIHIGDLCRLMDNVIANSGFKADVYNAGNGKQITVETIAELLRQNFNSQKPIRFSGQARKGDPLNWEAEISKAAGLGYRQKISFSEGVKEYVTYFKKWIAKEDN
jgi:UDP-glucose 4-epimerase